MTTSKDVARQRWALVTGGSGGIGAAIAQTLAAQGLAVWVHGNQNLARAQAVCEAIGANGGTARAIAFDVADAEATNAALAQMLEIAPIQVLVNNAGLHDDAVMPGMQPAQWQRVIDVNLNGFYNVTQPLLLPMLRTRWGRIVNVTSVAGQAGNRGQVNYAAAKGALHAATKALALEVASRGVTVNAVAPGIIDTAMSEASFDAERVKQLVPVQRAGQAQEVADLVAFLASPQAAYITAQTIAINGGMWAA